MKDLTAVPVLAELAHEPTKVADSGEARESTLTSCVLESRGGSQKSWVFTFRVKPPVNKTILVRFGATAFDAAYSELLDQWFMLCPGGTEEKICEPPMWFCDEEWAKTHQRDLTKPRLHSAGLRRQNPQTEFSF